MPKKIYKNLKLGTGDKKYVNTVINFEYLDKIPSNNKVKAEAETIFELLCEVVSWSVYNEVLKLILEWEEEKGHGDIEISKLLSIITGNEDSKGNESSPDKSKLLPTGIQELDRVLGGGFPIPSSVILAGDPGVGKSTLMLQVVSNVARAKGIESCVFFSAEQDISQIRKRVDEMDINKKFWVDPTDSLEHAIQIIKKERPKLVVIDSIRRMRTKSYSGKFDSPHYASYCGKELTNISKESRCSIVLINHMTKRGDMSGLKSLEHDVDVVLYIQGNVLDNIRILRSTKNRYSDTTEVGFFRMTEKGLIEVDDINDLFRQERKRKAYGVCLVVIQQGQRILPIEIHCIISNKGLGRITKTGFERDQIEKILSIVENRLNIALTHKRIIMSPSGNIELNVPYIELAMVSAILSSITKVDVSQMVFIGEVDLTGCVRPYIGQKKLLKSVLGVRDIKRIYAPKPIDPSDHLQDEKITYIDDIYSLSKSVFKL